MRKRLMSAVAALVSGATAMFFLDKDKGKRRRALMRDKVTKLWNDTTDEVEDISKDAANRLKGVKAETKNRFGTVLISDDTLTARIRSAMGHIIDNAQAVDVKVENGYVTLSGTLPPKEADKLVSKIKSMQGVEHIYNLIDTTEAVGENGRIGTS